MRTSSDLGTPGCCERWACYAQLDARKWKFHRLLLSSLALQAANVVVLALVYPDGVGAWEDVSVLAKLVTVVVQAVQVLVMAVSLIIIGRVVYAGRVSLGKAWQAYVVLCTGFAGIYYLLGLRPPARVPRSTLRSADGLRHHDADMACTRLGTRILESAAAPLAARPRPSQLRAEAFPLWVLMMYLSVATQTSVGFGDVVPNSVLAEYVAVLQMMFG